MPEGWQWDPSRTGPDPLRGYTPCRTQRQPRSERFVISVLDRVAIEISFWRSVQPACSAQQVRHRGNAGLDRALADFPSGAPIVNGAAAPVGPVRADAGLVA